MRIPITDKCRHCKRIASTLLPTKEMHIKNIGIWLPGLRSRAGSLGFDGLQGEVHHGLVRSGACAHLPCLRLTDIITIT
jgi:hypothetical protein